MKYLILLLALPQICYCQVDLPDSTAVPSIKLKNYDSAKAYVFMGTGYESYWDISDRNLFSLQRGKKYMVLEQARKRNDLYYVVDLDSAHILVSNSDFNSYLMPISEYNSLKKKYGINTWNDVLKRRVKIGWSKKLCQLSWGIPNQINRTTTSYDVEEQWVYYNNYLYFKNGILTTIQN
jgi:hypothetical protein